MQRWCRLGGPGAAPAPANGGGLAAREEGRVLAPGAARPQKGQIPNPSRQGTTGARLELPLAVHTRARNGGMSRRKKATWSTKVRILGLKTALCGADDFTLVRFLLGPGAPSPTRSEWRPPRSALAGKRPGGEESDSPRSYDAARKPSHDRARGLTAMGARADPPFPVRAGTLYKYAI